MLIAQIFNSIMKSVTYILYSEDVDYCVLIDCGYSEVLIPTLNELSKKVKAVFLTHTHYDHIYGLNLLLKHNPETLVFTNEEGRDALTDTKKNFSKYHPELVPFVFEHIENVRLLEEGERVLFADEKMRVIFTPGHDVSCISYMIGKNVFTGDSYLPGIKTVMNFPRSNRELALKNTAMLKELKQQGCTILCGHHSYL